MTEDKPLFIECQVCRCEIQFPDTGKPVYLQCPKCGWSRMYPPLPLKRSALVIR